MEQLSEVEKRAARVRLLVLDVDGVLTDGRLLLGPGGEEYKSFNVRDGHGIVMQRNSGHAIAIISGRTSQAVQERMQELGVVHVYQGESDKDQVLRRLLDELGIAVNEVCYVGDDLPDLSVMRRVQLAVAVADAHESIKAIAHWQTSNPGGHGAVREVCELLMRSQGTLDSQLERI